MVEQASTQSVLLKDWQFASQAGAAKAEYAASRLRDHLFFVGTNHAHRTVAGVRGDHLGCLRVTRFIQFNAEELQPVTDACTDEWRVFADASCED